VRNETNISQESTQSHAAIISSVKDLANDANPIYIYIYIYIRPDRLRYIELCRYETDEDEREEL
jgi:hypothetical protein